MYMKYDKYYDVLSISVKFKYLDIEVMDIISVFQKNII